MSVKLPLTVTLDSLEASTTLARYVMQKLGVSSAYCPDVTMTATDGPEGKSWSVSIRLEHPKEPQP